MEYGLGTALDLNEYKDDLPHVLTNFPDLEDTDPWPVVVGPGCLQHIRRGKNTPEDPLFGHINDWIKDITKHLYKTYRKM